METQKYPQMISIFKGCVRNELEGIKILFRALILYLCVKHIEKFIYLCILLFKIISSKYIYFSPLIFKLISFLKDQTISKIPAKSLHTKICFQSIKFK